MITIPLTNEVVSMLSQNKSVKTTEEVALQILLLCQVGVGTAVNIFLIVHNLSPILNGSQQRPIKVILANLAVGNTLILLFAFPNNMTLFVPKDPPTDLKCKLGYFIWLVARSTNMCSTCSLSTYQLVTLAPGTWGRVMLRGRAPKFVRYICYSCWLSSVLNNAHIPMKVSGPQKTHNDTNTKNKWVCSTTGFSIGMHILSFAHDAVFISIIIWSSVSMVILLNRHHQRLQHIQSPNQKLRVHAETRAAHTILMLVVTFVTCYLLDCICTFLHISFVDSRLWLRRVKEILAVSFPTFSPLLLIFRDPNDPCSLLFSC
uniref:Vomeronasal type-1 receptor n=1 Tax=Mus musculus domesticus TaxID=10092 RepID=F6MB30_MOUSE|nr:vomeronasal type 1 receptor D7 [Mus musculus domesticus]AEF00137.1 vomeronasal type 1 receptor D7 [Mus musculus domesticus]AEF00139.1 vomeronasal type 1 receptor D7 [Mus musculus domesticus]AEF00141.1 vomeronasal type 1 receptor D7 [Mus musculus domesticus]AEF00145.1 vomeronasal type 1 receptor D7 [Mus musculus domesticus]